LKFLEAPRHLSMSMLQSSTTNFTNKGKSHTMLDRAIQRCLVGSILVVSCVSLLAGCGGGGGGSSSSSSTSEPSSYITDQGSNSSANSEAVPLGGSSYPASSVAYEQYAVLTVTVTGTTLSGTLNVYTPAQPTSPTSPVTPAPLFVAGSYPVTGTTGTPYNGMGTITLAGTPTTTTALTVNGVLPATGSTGTVNVLANGQTYTGTFPAQSLN
jgi:hypothetical protein